MKYLLRRDFTSTQKKRRQPRPAVAHLWHGTDTLCRMWSTGGITKEKRYRVSDSPEDRPICQMCRDRQINASLNEQFKAAVR